MRSSLGGFGLLLPAGILSCLSSVKIGCNSHLLWISCPTCQLTSWYVFDTFSSTFTSWEGLFFQLFYLFSLLLKFGETLPLVRKIFVQYKLLWMEILPPGCNFDPPPAAAISCLLVVQCSCCCCCMPRCCSCSRVGGLDPHSAPGHKYLDKEQRTFSFQLFIFNWFNALDHKQFHKENCV